MHILVSLTNYAYLFIIILALIASYYHIVNIIALIKKNTSDKEHPFITDQKITYTDIKGVNHNGFFLDYNNNQIVSILDELTKATIWIKINSVKPR